MYFEDEFDLLDLLAYNCTNLMQQLSETASDLEKDDILEKYICSAEKEHKQIVDFEENLDWFNVTEPLTYSGLLQGKIVILDFFTYCCINCMHILPQLKKLENNYKIVDGLVIIGVHSAKFENEKDSANILSAVQRYDIKHPVVNDSNSSMWIKLKIKCWPTLLILGPRGNPLFVQMGEGHYDILEKYVKAAIKFYKTNGSIKSTTLPLNPAAELILSSNVKFPGKIACSKRKSYSKEAELFAISDTGNHRIIIVNYLGDVLQQIGGNNSGFIDGDFQTARFFAPQGLTFLNDYILFVADTENHAIRKINLKSRTVETVVGNGQQGNDRIGGKIGKDQAISSPWDVACHKTRDMDMSFHMDENSVPEKNIILIAMAGTHQIWALFLEDVIWWKFKKFQAYSCIAIVGNGNEENRNNSYPQNAAFAQPSGLAISREPKELFIADSESSCIRKIVLADGKVMPVVGGERNPLNLFAFGDIDGKEYAAKLQHPLGVAYNPLDNFVYVADTYNNKIKKIDITNKIIETCPIKNLNGKIHQFNEPGGLCVDSTGEFLYIADTNNHSIEILNLKLNTLQPFKLNYNRKSTLKHDVSLDLGSLKIRTEGGKIKFSGTIIFDENLRLTAGAPQTWIAYLPNENYFVDKQNGNINSDNKIEIDVTVPKQKVNNHCENIKIYLRLNHCNGGSCFQQIYLITIPLEFDESGLDCIIEDVSICLSEKTMRIMK